MRNIPNYEFYKTKYGSELLIDVVELKEVKKYFPEKALHTLSYYDITLITEGNGFFRIDDTNHSVEAMDVVFSGPSQLREWDTGNIINGYALIFEKEFLLSFFNDPLFIDRISYFKKNRTCSKLSLAPEEFGQINALIGQIRQEIDGYTVRNKHLLRALLYQVLMYLDRAFTRQHDCFRTNESNSYVESFLKLVDSDYAKDHQVQGYAEKLNLTPNYLNELVKRETGIPAKQVIRNKLMVEAKKLLLYTDLTISELSERLAFESPSYFIRFFCSLAGCTPLQFRKNEKP